MTSARAPSGNALDTQRLALAVFLARRDVLRMLSSSADGQQFSSPRATGCRPRRITDRTTYSMRSSRFGGHAAEPAVKSSNFHYPCPPGTSTSPPRAFSPPTHDPGLKPPRQTRPLHAPTDRQLQSSKDSHLRQLRSKIERYTSALAALRIQQDVKKCSTPDSSKPACPPPNLRRKPQNLFSPPKRSAKPNGRVTSVLHLRAVPLRMKASVRPRTSSRSVPLRASTSVTEYPITPNSKRAADHSLYKSDPDLVNTLWNEALTALRNAHTDAVVLKPDSCSSIQQIQDLYYPPPVSLSRSHVTADATTATSHTDGLGGSSTAVHIHPYEPAIAPHPPIETDYLLEQLHKVHLEEEAIRRRWTHLSSVSVDNSVHNETDPVNNEDRALACSEPGPSDQLQPKGVSFRKSFSRTSVPTPLATSTDDPVAFRGDSVATISPIANTAETDLMKLRLPTRLHRGILTEAAQRQAKMETSRMIMRDSNRTPTSIIDVCEDLASDLLEHLLSDVVAEIEHQTSRLIDQIVEGELCTEPPDSTSSCVSSMHGIDLQLGCSDTAFDKDAIQPVNKHASKLCSSPLSFRVTKENNHEIPSVAVT